MIETAVGHGSVIQTRNRAKALLRDCFLMLGRVFPPLVAFLKFGEGWHIGAGLLACDGAPPPGGVIGKPIPQPWLETSGGQRRRLDELLGDGFSAVGFNLNPAAVLDGATGRDSITYGKIAPLVCLQIGPGGHATDTSRMLSGWADTHGIGIAIVRPDRQVYGVCGRVAGTALHSELSGLLSRLEKQLLP